MPGEDGEDWLYKNRLLYEPSKEAKEVQGIRKVETLLDIDIREVLERVERKYRLKLPRKVVTVDYGDDVGDLYVRFKHARRMEGEPTKDGQAILHYDEDKNLAAVEILDITTL